MPVECLEAGSGSARLTLHARQRLSQRGLRAEVIAIAVQLGVRSWNRGCYCHRITDRCLRGTAYERRADRLRGLCVVMAPDGVVVTVKREWDRCERGPLCRSRRMLGLPQPLELERM